MKREILALMIISFLLTFMSLILMGMAMESGTEFFSFFAVSLIVSFISFVYSLIRLKK